jgi:DNA-binding SARP family transcriptional activator
MAHELRLRLLGYPRVTLGNVPLTFHRRKSLAALAYLVLSRRAHARDELAALLSPMPADSGARKQLRNALFDLPLQIGDYLLVTRQTIAFDFSRPYWLDVEVLQVALDPTADTADLQQAVSLYQADVLAGFILHNAPSFELWLARERDRARQLVIRALLTLQERAIRSGDEIAALRYSTRLLAVEQRDETLIDSDRERTVKSGHTSAPTP